MTDQLSNHPLNKLALAMLNRWSSRQMLDLMPVLELALEAVPEGLEDGPEGQAFDRARRSEPEAILAQLSEAFQPEDLLDAKNVQEAGLMILNELMASGELTDSQLYREASQA
jgi:glutathione S-transferase